MSLFKPVNFVCQSNKAYNQMELQATYDDSGVITSVFMYDYVTDTSLKLDLESFEVQHPTKYADLQQRVNEALDIQTGSKH